MGRFWAMRRAGSTAAPIGDAGLDVVLSLPPPFTWLHLDWTYGGAPPGVPCQLRVWRWNGSSWESFVGRSDVPLGDGGWVFEDVPVSELEQYWASVEPAGYVLTYSNVLNT